MAREGINEVALVEVAVSVLRLIFTDLLLLFHGPLPLLIFLCFDLIKMAGHKR